jgi:hypothetical protein
LAGVWAAAVDVVPASVALAVREKVSVDVLHSVAIELDRDRDLHIVVVVCDNFLHVVLEVPGKRAGRPVPGVRAGAAVGVLELEADLGGIASACLVRAAPHPKSVATRCSTSK